MDTTSTLAYRFILGASLQEKIQVCTLDLGYFADTWQWSV